MKLVDQVDPREFFSKPYYTGKYAKTLYPVVRDDLVRIFDDKWVGYYMGSAIGAGKSLSCRLALLRMIYELKQLGDPARALGLVSGSPVHLAYFTERLEFGRRAMHDIVQAMHEADYFSETEIETTAESIRLPQHNIEVVFPRCDNVSAVGLNIHGAVFDLDDVYRGKAGDKVKTIIATIERRMKTRYLGNGLLPGRLLISSSARSYYAVAHQNYELRVISRALWDARPAEFSQKTFMVVYGLPHNPNDAQWAEIVRGDRLCMQVDDRCEVRVIQVPEDLRRDFERDLPGSLCDLAGIPFNAPFAMKSDA